MSILASTAQYTRVTQGNAIFYYDIISGNDIWIAGVDLQSPVFLNEYDTLTIPAILDGKNVKEIGLFGYVISNPRNGIDPAEYYTFPTSVKHVILEEGIEKIKMEGLRNMGLVESYTLPSTLNTIEDYGFAWGSMKKITIPNSVTTIGEFSFFSCSNLEYAKVSENITSLNNYVFRLCSKLRKLDIRSCTTLGNRSINLCDSLRTVIISPNLASIVSGTIDTDTFYESRLPDTIKISEGSTIIPYCKQVIADLEPKVIEIEDNFGTITSDDYATMATGTSKTLILNAGNTYNVLNANSIDKLILKSNNEQSLPEVTGENLTLINGLSIQYTIPNNSRWHHLSLPFDCNSWSAQAAEGTDVTNSINTYWRMQTFDSDGYAATNQVENADPWTQVSTRPTSINKGVGFSLLNRLIDIPITFEFKTSNNYVISTPNNENTTITKYENQNGDPSLQNWNFIGFNSLQNVGNSENIHVSSYDGYLEGIEPIIMVLDNGSYLQKTLSNITIKPCQAFFMQIASLENANGNITINPNSAPLLNMSDKLTFDIIPIHLKTALYEDITTLYIGNRFTDNYETGADFLKFNGTDTIKPRIASIIKNYNLGFAAFSISKNTKTIPLNIYVKKGIQHTFSIQNPKNKDIENIYLIDKETNTQHDLLKGEYSWTPNDDINSKTRFELRINRIITSTESTNTYQNIWTENKQIHIKYTKNDKNFTIFQYDGKIVSNGNFDKNKNLYISPVLKPGIYILHIVSNNQIKNAKIVIE